MKQWWKNLLRDETGVVLSSELVLVGTVGVLSMVVGMEAVSSAVVQELNDLSGAFGAFNQTYNYRSLSKVGHASIIGGGFVDRGDQCDCMAITQTDVGGAISGGRITGGGLVLGQARTSAGSPIVREPVIEERILSEQIIEDCPVQEIKPAPCEGEIIEEHVVRRVRISPDCAASLPLKEKHPTLVNPQQPQPLKSKKPDPNNEEPRKGKPEPKKK
jgi:hypothetical protein